MLDLGLMDMTPDIDMVCRDAAGRTRLLEAARGLGLEIFGPEKRHDRLGLGRINIKGGTPWTYSPDRISYDFRLYVAM